ncbi:MAG: thioredoxin [Bacilli bacterium]|nr:thioredoxin [Bacilli bacterium]
MEIEIKSADQFKEESASGRVLVDFYATWCGPCKMLAPFVQKLADQHPEVKVLKVDVDEVGDLAQSFEVYSIPTLLYFEDGKVVRKSLGFMPEPQLLKFAGIE